MRNIPTYHEEDNVKKKTLLGLFLFLAIGILVACGVEPEPVETKEPEETQELYSRCDLFTDEELSVVLYGIYPSDTSVKMYVKFESGEVIGLEDGTDDGFSWDYTATLGEVESLGCNIFEGEEYAGRLYCVLPLPAEYRNAAKQFFLYVNECPEKLLSIPRLSLTVEKMAGSGGSGGGSSGGSDKKLSVQFKKLCGVAPEQCSLGFEVWCNCMGGYYWCENPNPVCDLP